MNQTKTLSSDHLIKISVEYCTNCASHNWCTHHNQQKYQESYTDLQSYLRKELSNFQNIHVVGNQIPSSYIPIKVKQNKYYDTIKQKYIIFPGIGTFQIRCNDVIIFSKKGSNCWPNNKQIALKIKLILNSKNKQNSYRLSEPQEIDNEKNNQVKYIDHQISNDDSKTENTVCIFDKKLNSSINPQDKLRQLDKNSTFYPRNPKNSGDYSQQKQFTLTDHFKKYKMNNNKYQKQTRNSLSKEKSNKTMLTKEDLKQINNVWGNKFSDNLPNFMNKAYIQENNTGKKEMLVNLSSIEEENEHKKYQNSYVKKNKNSIHRISNLGAQIHNFQKRFSKFEKKVEEANQKRMQFEVQGDQLAVSAVQEKNNRGSVRPDDQMNNSKEIMMKFDYPERLQDLKKYNASQVLKQLQDNKHRKIEEYIFGTPQEKNQKLSKIYGPYILKKFQNCSTAGKKKNTSTKKNSNHNSPSKKQQKKIKEKINKRKNVQKKLSLSSSPESQNSQSSQNPTSSLSSRLHGEQDSNTEIEVSPELVQKHKSMAYRVKKYQRNMSNKIIQKKIIRDSEIGNSKYSTANNFYKHHNQTKKKDKNNFRNPKEQLVENIKDKFSELSLQSENVKHKKQFELKKKQIIKPIKKLQRSPQSQQNKYNPNFNAQKLKIKTKQRLRDKQSVSDVSKNNNRTLFAKKQQQQRQHHKLEFQNSVSTPKDKQRKNKLDNIYGQHSKKYKQWRSQLDGTLPTKLKKLKNQQIKYSRNSDSCQMDQNPLNTQENPQYKNITLEQQSSSQFQQEDIKISKKKKKTKIKIISPLKNKQPKSHKQQSQISDKNSPMKHENTTSKKMKGKTSLRKKQDKQTKENINSSRIKQMPEQKQLKAERLSNKNQSFFKSEDKQKTINKNQSFAKSENKEMAIQNQSFIKLESKQKTYNQNKSQNKQKKNNKNQSFLKSENKQKINNKNQSFVKSESKEMKNDLNKSFVKSESKQKTNNKTQKKHKERKVKKVKNVSLENKSKSKRKESSKRAQKKKRVKNSKRSKKQKINGQDHQNQASVSNNSSGSEIDPKQIFQNSQRFSEDNNNSEQISIKMKKILPNNGTIMETSQNYQGTSQLNSKQTIQQKSIYKEQAQQQKNEDEQSYSSQQKKIKKESLKKHLPNFDNVLTESVPRKIYAMGESPETEEKEVQTDNKVTKFVQTSQRRQAQSEQLQAAHLNPNNRKGKHHKKERLLEEKKVKQEQNLNSPEKKSANKCNDKKQLQKTKGNQSKSKSKSKTSKNYQETQAAIIRQFYGKFYEEQLSRVQEVIADQHFFVDTPFFESDNGFQMQLISIEEMIKNKQKSTNFHNYNLFQKHSIQAEKVVNSSGLLAEVFKALKIISSKNQYLIIRLFQNSELVQPQKKYGIWLCDSFQWKCFFVDDMIAVDSNKNPVCFSHLGNQLWPLIIEKALMILFGGYRKLEKASVGQIFHALTGCNHLSIKVRQDLSKNTQLLKFIVTNQKKNYILVARKRNYNSINESIEEAKQASVYYILSQKTINENEIVLRMKKDKSDAFWIKLDKFATEFDQMEVLQLRVNHNFYTTTIIESKTGKYNVYEMDFDDSGFGCIAVTSTKVVSDFKIYLYKEEEDNMLRLVGQVKQRNKNSIFFDCLFEQGRYYLFLEMAVKQGNIFFAGETRPNINQKQSVNGQNFKNDHAEYVPVQSINKKRDSQMPKLMSMSVSRGFGTSKEEQQVVEFDKVSKASHQSNLKKQYIRNQFIEFLMDRNS